MTNSPKNVEVICKPWLDIGSFYLRLEGPFHNATNFEF